MVPAEQTTHAHHHPKKTWVTDVNVYSKKKNGDDLTEFFNDDNDPLDEFGKSCSTTSPIFFILYCSTFEFCFSIRGVRSFYLALSDHNISTMIMTPGMNLVSLALQSNPIFFVPYCSTFVFYIFHHRERY